LGDKRPIVFAGDDAGQNRASAGHREGNRSAATHFKRAIDSRLSASPRFGDGSGRQVERRPQLHFHRRRRVLLFAAAAALISQVVEILDNVIEALKALLAAYLLLKVVSNLRGVATDEVTAAGADALLAETAGIALAESALLIAEAAGSATEAAAAEHRLTEAAASAETAGAEPTVSKGTAPKTSTEAASSTEAAPTSKSSVAEVAAAKPTLLVAPLLELGVNGLYQDGRQKATDEKADGRRNSRFPS
jgi:hypothetical protein